MVGRELELWRPLYALAAFFDKCSVNAPSQSAQGSLIPLMKALSCKLAKQRHTENVANVREENLIQCLLELVPEKQAQFWVKVKDVKELMASRCEEYQEWLTSAWIGKALRRLGFEDKRRLGTGAQYDVPSATLEDVRIRMEVEVEPKKETSSQQKLGVSGRGAAIAAHCKKRHTGECSFPGDPNCIVPTNPCAKTCPDYEEREPETTQRVSEVTEVGSEAPCKPTILEILETLRPNMVGAFADEELLAKIMNLGFSREEAQKRVDHFKAKELIIRDDVGNWHFSR